MLILMEITFILVYKTQNQLNKTCLKAHLLYDENCIKPVHFIAEKKLFFILKTLQLSRNTAYESTPFFSDSEISSQRSSKVCSQEKGPEQGPP
jgi:hypothetical protein